MIETKVKRGPVGFKACQRLIVPGVGVVVACAIRTGVRTAWPCEVIECASLGGGINERGDVVGTTQDPLGPVSGFAMLFPRKGGSVVLGPGAAGDLNNAGVVTGIFDTRSSNLPAATIWRRGRVYEAPALGHAVTVAINARGWTVGTEFRGDGSVVAFFWNTVGTRLLYLGTEYSSSEAVGINDKGDIVGFVDAGSGVREVVIWHPKP